MACENQRIGKRIKGSNLMEYAKIILKDLRTGKQISKTPVLPKSIIILEYANLLTCSINKLLESFSTIHVVKVDPKEFIPENLLLYMKLKMNEIDHDTYQSQIQL